MTSITELDEVTHLCWKWRGLRRWACQSCLQPRNRRSPLSSPICRNDVYVYVNKYRLKVWRCKTYVVFYAICWMHIFLHIFPFSKDKRVKSDRNVETTCRRRQSCRPCCPGSRHPRAKWRRPCRWVTSPRGSRRQSATQPSSASRSAANMYSVRVMQQKLYY